MSNITFTLVSEVDGLQMISLCYPTKQSAAGVVPFLNRFSTAVDENGIIP